MPWASASRSPPPDKELGLRARDFGTVEKIAGDNALTVRMDSGKTVELEPARARHVEYGYVVDGLKAVAADRVLVTVESAQQLTRESPVYTAISRASQDATIYISDYAALTRPASSVVELQQPASDRRQEQGAEQKPPETAREFQPSPVEQQRPAEQAECVYTWAEHERHFAPLNKALTPAEAEQFAWRAETGTIQSYQHNETHRHIHIDGASGQFYDHDRNPISRDAALDHAMPAGHAHSHQNSPAQNFIGHGLSQRQSPSDNSQGFGL